MTFVVARNNVSLTPSLCESQDLRWPGLDGYVAGWGRAHQCPLVTTSVKLTTNGFRLKSKGKDLSCTLPSARHVADPGVQAVNLQMT